MSGEGSYSRAVGRALRDVVRRERAGWILRLAGSGLWKGDLAVMRGDAQRGWRREAGRRRGQPTG